MANSYDSELSTPRDRARRRLGDVGRLRDSAGEVIWLMPNETIDALIEREGFGEALAIAADSLRAEYASEPDVFEDESGVRVEWKSRFDAWRDLAKQMRASRQAGSEVAQPSRIASGKLTDADTEKLR